MQNLEKHLHNVDAKDDKPSTFLCNLDALEEPGSLGFELDGDDGGLFVVRHDSGIFAYRNSCPHTGAPLDWLPDQFLDPDGALIQCAMHGALFSIDTGECLHGPCVGASLEPLPIQVIDKQVHLVEIGTASEE